jgi:hypothetical protein
MSMLLEGAISCETYTYFGDRTLGDCLTAICTDALYLFLLFLIDCVSLGIKYARTSMRLLSNKELEQLIREGEQILKQEERKKRRMKTLIRWLAWAVILTGVIYLEMHGLRL